jgi:hypothetical protein
MAASRDKIQIERARIIGDWIARALSAVVIAALLYAVISKYV